MWKAVSLPFQNSVPLPTLPTVDEIRGCKDVIWERYASKVVAINDEIVVKYGNSIRVWEGQALIYLEQHAPGVPAPRLYAMYKDSGQTFLVMQRAPGVQLDSIWPSLTESEKDSIVAKLHQTFDYMRHVQCPWPDFFGGLDGGSAYQYLFYSPKDGGGHKGPFRDESALVAALTGNFRALIERNGRSDYKARFYETHLSRVLRNHRPTLTHGDVQQKNIMVAEDPSRGDNGDRSFNIVLVDWEHAGWFPDFWEFFRASTYFDMVYWEDDWCWRTEQFLQVWPAELGIMRMLDKDYRGW